VAEQCRRQGLGTQATIRMIDLAARRGADDFCLLVDAPPGEEPKALGLYRRIGFTFVAEQEVDPVLRQTMAAWYPDLQLFYMAVHLDPPFMARLKGLETDILSWGE
jgi:GNAT superfamily N-acetyltransferase